MLSTFSVDLNSSANGSHRTGFPIHTLPVCQVLDFFHFILFFCFTACHVLTEQLECLSRLFSRFPARFLVVVLCRHDLWLTMSVMRPSTSQFSNILFKYSHESEKNHDVTKFRVKYTVPNINPLIVASVTLVYLGSLLECQYRPLEALFAQNGWIYEAKHRSVKVHVTGRQSLVPICNETDVCVHSVRHHFCSICHLFPKYTAIKLTSV